VAATKSLLNGSRSGTQPPRIAMQRIYRSMCPGGLNFRLPFDERITSKKSMYFIKVVKFFLLLLI
jgi:hypothetical protein